MINIEIGGADSIIEAREILAQMLDPEVLRRETIAIAQEAGKMLEQAAIEQCDAMIYEMLSGGEALFTPIVLGSLSGTGSAIGGNMETRTGDLKDAHKLNDLGLIQEVEIDPEMPVSDDAHSGRWNVIDYAVPVHEGYVQQLFGRPTAQYHPGRPWMRQASEASEEEIFRFVEAAFMSMIDAAFNRLAA